MSSHPYNSDCRCHKCLDHERAHFTEADLRDYVISELDVALAEMRVPMNTGLIAESKIRHVQKVLAAWPNVTYYGKPLVGNQPTEQQG